MLNADLSFLLQLWYFVHQHHQVAKAAAEKAASRIKGSTEEGGEDTPAGGHLSSTQPSTSAALLSGEEEAHPSTLPAAKRHKGQGSHPSQ